MTQDIYVIYDFVNWLDGQKSKRLRIDNDKLIIHDIVIAECHPNQFIVNITEYDYSITNIQNLLIKALKLKGFLNKVKYVYDL